VIKQSKSGIWKKRRFTLNGHTSSVTSVVTSPDGKFLVSGPADKTIKVWNLEEKRVYFKRSFIFC
jgi:FOG: WD40 repeat